MVVGREELGKKEMEGGRLGQRNLEFYSHMFWSSSNRHSNPFWGVRKLKLGEVQ